MDPSSNNCIPVIRTEERNRPPRDQSRSLGPSVASVETKQSLSTVSAANATLAHQNNEYAPDTATINASGLPSNQFRTYKSEQFTGQLSQVLEVEEEEDEDYDERVQVHDNVETNENANLHSNKTKTSEDAKTMEQVEKQHPSPNPVRALFQEEDEKLLVESNRRFIERQIDAMRLADSLRWNFDFRNCRPLTQDINNNDSVSKSSNDTGNSNNNNH